MSRRKGRDIGIARPGEKLFYTAGRIVMDEAQIYVTHADPEHDLTIDTTEGKLVIDFKTIGRGLSEPPATPVHANPPALGQSLVALLLSGQRREAVLGDLDELLQQDRDRYGVRRARLLYMIRAVQFIWPVLRRAVGRLVGWGVVAALVRRFLSGG